MPLYNYKCPHCGFEFEKLSIKYNVEKIKYHCPNCLYIAEYKDLLPASGIFRINLHSRKEMDK